MPLYGPVVPVEALPAPDGYLVYPLPLQGLREALSSSRFLQVLIDIPLRT